MKKQEDDVVKPEAFPPHETLHLEHNAHKAYYLTVQEEVNGGALGYGDDAWVSPEQRQKAIDTNDCWTLQWYPNTPVGFCTMSAADLDALLEAVKK